MSDQPRKSRQQRNDRKLSKPGGQPQRRSSSTVQAAQITVGNFLRATRESQNLTQAQVAHRTKDHPWQLSRAAVSAIERGQNFPGLEAMLALSSVLHIDPKELIERARLTAVVPVDITGLDYDDLESRASQYFWAGEFKKALSVYDAMLEKIALEDPEESDALRTRIATLEVRRATTLKRAGALVSAIASAERAILLSRDEPAVLAEAYVVLADLQVQRGHLPLARDAAERAVKLAAFAGPATRAFAGMVKGRVFYLDGDFPRALRAFQAAREHARDAADETHLTHIEGNIGTCWLEQGKLGEARESLELAVKLARKAKQPHLEASWSVELGKIALSEDRPEDATRLARTALRIARPRDHYLTIFRAEWLLHLLAVKQKPEDPDRQRLAELRELFAELDQHEGIQEIQEFRAKVLRSRGVDDEDN